MRVNPDLLAMIVLGYLRKHAGGRAAARTQGRIGWDLRRLGLVVTTRDVRDALATLVLAGWPVATTTAKPAGAYLCVTRDDFLTGYANLYKRVRIQAKRCRRFKATARAALSGQTTFDWYEADARYADLANAPLLVGEGGRA